MTTALEREKDRIRTVTRLLHQACKPIRVLRTIDWAPEVKATFLASGCRELPQVTYPPFDPEPTLAAVREARRLTLPVTTIDNWLERHAHSIELAARMLVAVGTPSFFEFGRQIYGEPTAPLRYADVTPLDLAQSVIDTIAQLTAINIPIAPPTYHDAETVAADLTQAVKAHFGDQAPAVELVDRLSANALATAKAIRVRRGARFTDRDYSQLLNHEAYIHVATSLNGQAQTDLPLLAAGHPGTTRTQEGLAVLAEIISGSIELDRLRRLADRVLAIQMAIEGADFLQVHAFFMERTGDPDQAYENTRRVFRGGVITGGAPFCKDLVYLLGLLQVNNFIRTAFNGGRADCLSLLFCGKLDFFDIPALCELYALGLCRPPLFLPPWISDPRYLLALLTFAQFIQRVNLGPLAELARKLLDSAPLVQLPTSPQA